MLVDEIVVRKTFLSSDLLGLSFAHLLRRFDLGVVRVALNGGEAHCGLSTKFCSIYIFLQGPAGWLIGSRSLLIWVVLDA